MNNIGNFNKEIEKEIVTKGYHVLKKSKAKVHGNYPNKFPEYKDIKIEIGKIYVIRIFVNNTMNGIDKIDSGLMNVKILMKNESTYKGTIQTILPQGMPIKTGENINISEDEILYEQNE